MFEEDNEINEQDLLDGLWAGNLGAVAFLYMVTWGERQEDKGGSEEKKVKSRRTRKLREKLGTPTSDYLRNSIIVHIAAVICLNAVVIFFFVSVRGVRLDKPPIEPDSIFMWGIVLGSFLTSILLIGFYVNTIMRGRAKEMKAMEGYKEDAVVRSLLDGYEDRFKELEGLFGRVRTNVGVVREIAISQYHQYERETSKPLTAPESEVISVNPLTDEEAKKVKAIPTELVKERPLCFDTEDWTPLTQHVPFEMDEAPPQRFKNKESEDEYV